MSKKNQQESNNIRVVLRCRPLNKLEIEQGGEQCVKIVDDSTVQVIVAGEEQPHQFSFDKIFPSDTRQIDVFKEVGQPVLECIMQGINSTIFAYGQTSSGKTHTMEGKHDDPEYMGLIPRMMDKLFDMIADAPSTIEFSIKASFLEIYNEKIHDLLDPSKTNLNVKEDKLRGIFVQDATEAFVVKASDMMKVMRKGADNRSVAATRMNERSSRSHSIFLLTLIQKNTETETSRLSKLYFVDLAGSEKIAKTHVSGQQLEEAKNINKSLTCLGIVINSLSEKKEHIPYRDSKLTRILQESIGGNSKTTLIIACSMCSYNDKETISTLRFGQRAKSIKNQAKVNEEKSAKELMQLLAKAENMIKYKDEIIAALQQQLGQENITPVAPNKQLSKSNSVADISFSFNRQLTRSETEIEENTRNIENESPSIQLKPVAPQEQQETAKPKKSTPTNKLGGVQKQNNPNTSRKLLEQHLEIIKLKEKIEKLEGEKHDLEIDLANKTTELQMSNEKCKSMSEAMEQTYTDCEAQLKKYQDQMENMQVDTLEWNTYTRELKKSTNRLQSDLNYLLLSTEIKSMDIKNIDANGFESQEGKICQTIKKTLEQIDAINSYIGKFEQVQSLRTMTEGSETDERKMKTVGDEDKPHKKKEDIKLKSFVSPRSKHGGFIRLQQSTSDYNEVLSTEADDVIFTEDSIPSTTSNTGTNGSNYLKDNNMQQPTDQLIMERNESEDEDHTEEEEDIKDIIEITKSITSLDEVQREELMTYIISIKRQVRKLTQQNKEYVLNIENYQSSSDCQIQKYKKKIQEIKKTLNQKLKDQEIKLLNLSTKLNEKATEIKNLTLKHEKELIDKNQTYANLKVEFENLKKVISSNHPVSKIAELQQKIKELGTDRQKLFNELFAARNELDQKEITLKEKDSQIQLMRKTMQKQNGEFNNIKSGGDFLVSSRGALLERKTTVNDLDSSGQKQKSISLKSHIAPSIRGGGGDFASFQKNNQYLLSDEANEDNYDDNTDPKLRNTKQQEISKSINTFDQKMKHAQLSSTKKTMNRIDEEDDMANDFAQIEPSAFELEKKFNIIGQKKIETEKSTTSSIFGAVKKIFM
ncbi:kinesin motor catalytic domain protein (macronuclear) [Tetrahymena thermophila SB210]|uniref:Kinesin motor catalytic domain protein n=1 Tax=Tetrahymena thermophila (strain SB210) TaxID=312017 RepID=I7MHK4_TETTS|nr:kinesin motor catalytic domain protein [Tetrahymena thermophila SB210]EAS03052.3 kinesin motor catalytic domain protein [Tetrahymena thermophila SB210]|eukprot:XP_001023297.3 kinesin motor catalytic domain protein [Tetrahymena thermophila SB210]